MTEADRESFRAALRAGVALYNAGEYHAAHDPWESQWLPLPAGGDDERLLHGLIQVAAAVHHARTRNWAGATGLADSAGDYLAALPADYRGIDLPPVRRFLDRLAADPERVERGGPPPLRHEGVAVDLADLGFDAAVSAAAALAAEYDRYDAAVVADAARFARGERGTGRTQWTALLMDFAARADDRDLIYRRLADHVARERSKEADVEGLF